MPRLEHVLVLGYGTGSDHRGGRTAGQVRARLALPGPGGQVPGRRTARGTGVRHQAGGVRGFIRRPARAGRLLPAHGRRPHPGHGQGRRRRLPVPRLALGRGRPVRGDPVRPAGPGGGPHQVLAGPGAQRAAVRLARRRGQPAAGRRRRSRGSRASGSPEWTDWTWDSILVEGANCREVIDNVVDMAHFFYIHFAFPTFFKNVFEGHIATQYLTTRSRPDIDGVSNYSSGGRASRPRCAPRLRTTGRRT